MQHLLFLRRIQTFLTKLEKHSIIAIEWFENNFMEMSSGNYHLFCLRKKVIIEYGKIEHSNSQYLQ